MNATTTLTLASAVVALLGAACATPLPPVPDALAPPAGHTLAMTVAARGVQVYECRAGADDRTAWAFVGPEADLLDASGRHIGQHGNGPHWTATDGSRIVGRVAARADAPQPGAIPWLLITTDAVGSQPGAFSRVGSVQRVMTSGGVAPSTPCSRSTLGAVARIPYTADYRLFNR